MTLERIIPLLLAKADPMPPEDHPEWTELAAVLEQNPHLQAWFADPTPAESALRQALQNIRTDVPPPSLIACPNFTRRRWLAAAACAAASTSAWLLRPVGYRHAEGLASFDNFREDMSIFASRLFKLEHKETSFPGLLTYLHDHQAPTPSTLPAAITEGKAKGCKPFQWGVHTVGLICFYRPSGELVHLYTVPAAALQSVPRAEAMRTAQTFTPEFHDGLLE